MSGRPFVCRWSAFFVRESLPEPCFALLAPFFRIYASALALQLRAHLGINMASFARALDGKSSGDFSMSEGASGALLVLSDDGYYVVRRDCCMSAVRMLSAADRPLTDR